MFGLGAISSSAVERRQIGEPVCFYPHGLHLFEQSRPEIVDNSESGKQTLVLEPRVSRGSSYAAQARLTAHLIRLSKPTVAAEA